MSWAPCGKHFPSSKVSRCEEKIFVLGEVFVLDDGGEVDLDLGNYERFLDVTLKRDNNITTGKIYQHVIQRERNGDYLGKTVQGEIYVRGCTHPLTVLKQY